MTLADGTLLSTVFSIVFNQTTVKRYKYKFKILKISLLAYNHANINYSLLKSVLNTEHFCFKIM